MLKRRQDWQDTSYEAINRARILYYDFFAGLFLYDLLIGRRDLISQQISILKTQPLHEGDLESFEILEGEIRTNGLKNIIFEYTRFFMLPFDTSTNISNDKSKPKSTQITLYLSYYLDKTIAGSGLIKAKEKVRKSKIRLNDKEFKENEEHIGFLFLFSKYLLQNDEYTLQGEVFKDCIKPMKDHIIEDIKGKYPDSMYCHVAMLLWSFLEFELAFAGH